MSADSWASCPQCKIDRENKLVELERQLTEAYGKGSLEDFRSQESLITQKIRNIKDNIEASVREYHEIGIYEGRFIAKYQATCEGCNFTYRYEFTDSDLI